MGSLTKEVMCRRDRRDAQLLKARQKREQKKTLKTLVEKKEELAAIGIGVK